jgi:hypothetical protein
MMLLSTDRLLIRVHRLALAADMEMITTPLQQFSKTKLREETENVYRAYDDTKPKIDLVVALLAKAPANTYGDPPSSAFPPISRHFDIGLSPQTAAIPLSS